MQPKRILILGGTAEARELARILVGHGCDVTTALAGVTAEPVLPAGAVRIGGFGGEAGIARFLAENDIDAIADTTHPFAAQISRHAAAAAQHQGTPYVRLERAAWVPSPADRWTDVADAAAAARALPPKARVLLTVGRREIDAFLARRDISGVVRMIEPSSSEIPSWWRLLRARPPFTFPDELALMEAERITHLVTKNSGGQTMRSKLDAARERNIAVVMIARPAKPDAPTAATPQALAALLLA